MTADLEPTYRNPFAAAAPRPSLVGVLAEGPVRFLQVAGDLDDGSWGVAGSFWLSMNGERGGFVVSPRALWTGTELARSYHGARERGWTCEQIYRYWQGQVGLAGRIMIDPQQHASSLLQIHKRVGAL
ncbi:MAG: hypothetical protein H0W82_00185 [Actinobacteria bacterium]|nr:hypothetical protein [Actinomycetota bacterium]